MPRPVNAFFSTDSNTAYVINCGPECGSTAGPPSVSQLDIASQTIKATVAVGGASVGLLNGTTLYVAGTPGTTGTYDAVNVGTMTRTTTNSVAIGDGTHASMALATNNKLYIGASTCANQTPGCLSVVDVSANTADAPLPPRGNVTGMLAIAGRNTVYVIEGGYLVIYDTSTDTPQQDPGRLYRGPLRYRPGGPVAQQRSRHPWAMPRPVRAVMLSNELLCCHPEQRALLLSS